MAGGAAVQAKIVFPAAFFLNGGDRTPLLAAVLTCGLSSSGGEVHWPTMSASAGARPGSGGVLTALGAGRVPGFALSPDLVIDLNAELDEGIKIIRCGLVGKGLPELLV